MSLALLRNWLMAALRSMAASPLQSAIAIGSLAIGLWAAILAGVIADNQANYDRFIPGSHQLYIATFQGLGGGGDVHFGAGPAPASTVTPHDLARYLRGFPEVRDVARLSNSRGTFSRGDRNNREEFSWADPNFFELVRLPALYGDPATALERPDGVVITRSVARKYFGRNDARGEILTLNHQAGFIVRAVIADLPPHASNLTNEIYLSALAPVSPLTLGAVQPGMGPQVFMMSVTTFARVADSGVDGLARKATAQVRRVLGSQPIARILFVRFLRLDEIPLSPQIHPANRDRLEIFIAISALVLLLACINFVSLSLARSMRRAVEVGIRKAAGAGRGMLLAQFLGETVLQAMMALCAAMALAEWSLPLVNNYMQSGAVFRWWRDSLLLAVLLGGTALVGMIAGIYPALVLSAFRPVSVLKGLTLRGSSLGTRVCQALVALQFAIPLALVIATIVVFQQDRFAATEALRLDTDRMLMINLPTCGSAMDAEVSALPGRDGRRLFRSLAAAQRHAVRWDQVAQQPTLRHSDRRGRLRLLPSLSSAGASGAAARPGASGRCRAGAPVAARPWLRSARHAAGEQTAATAGALHHQRSGGEGAGVCLGGGRHRQALAFKKRAQADQ